MKEITRTPQSRPAKKDRNLTRWLFVAPAMLVVLCLLVYPLCSTLLYSFTNKTLIKSTYAFKGIDNYIKIFTDPAFGKAFLTTLVWTFFSLTGQILIGFSAALALNRIRNPIARPIYRICMIICARPDVDAVIVATPNYLHKEPVLEAARNHKNVFCEKPIALSYADCDEMVNTCKENNVVFMAGHVMNFFHGVRLAKKFIQEGRIGKVLYAHSARNGWEEPQPSISWKKIRSKSGGHLYHHIHELDCIQFIMGPATRVTMTGGNVAHSGPEFGDEDDMLFLNLEFGNNTYAIVEYGSAFHWPEHYVLIQGTKGAIRIDMCNVGMTVKLADGTEEHYCVHANKEIDDDRTRIYHSTEMDGAIQYGHPGKKPPMWLNSIMNAEMEFFNGVMHGDPIPDEFKPLMTGEAARAAIATADAATLSLRENRKVSVEEVMK